MKIRQCIKKIAFLCLVAGLLISWLEGVKDQKPACSNGKAMVLALKLYEATKDEYYLEVGKKFYHWIDKYLKDPERGVVWNSWLTTTSAV